MTTSAMLEKMAAVAREHPVLTDRFARLTPGERDYHVCLLVRQLVPERRWKEVRELKLVIGHLNAQAERTTLH